MLAVLPFCTTVPRAYAFSGFVDDVMKFNETVTCTDPNTGNTTTRNDEINAYVSLGFETILVPFFTPPNEWASKWSVKQGGRSIEGDARHLVFDTNTTGNWNVTSTK
jgi:hypothetical protein